MRTWRVLNPLLPTFALDIVMLFYFPKSCSRGPLLKWINRDWYCTDYTGVEHSSANGGKRYLDEFNPVLETYLWNDTRAYLRFKLCCNDRKHELWHTEELNMLRLLASRIKTLEIHPLEILYRPKVSDLSSQHCFRMSWSYSSKLS